MMSLVLLTFVTLDGIMQTPGGPMEETCGDFKYGGCTVGYWDDLLAKSWKHKWSE